MGYYYDCAVAMTKINFEKLGIEKEDAEKLEKLIYNFESRDKDNIALGFTLLKGFCNFTEGDLEFYDAYEEALKRILEETQGHSWVVSKDGYAIGCTFNAKGYFTSRVLNVLREELYEYPEHYGFVSMGEDPGDDTDSGDLVGAYVFANRFASFDDDY